MPQHMMKIIMIIMMINSVGHFLGWNSTVIFFGHILNANKWSFITSDTVLWSCGWIKEIVAHFPALLK